MNLGRRGEAHRINFTNQCAPILRPSHIAFFADGARRRFVEIADEDKVCDSFIGERSVNARVLSS